MWCSDQAPEYFAELLALSPDEQVSRCRSFFHKKTPRALISRCNARVDKVIGITPWSPHLSSSSGFTVVESDEDPWYGSALVRGTVDVKKKSLTIYKKALEELGSACQAAGLTMPCPLKDIMLAHEAFHILDPRCPSDLAETSAHLYATRIHSLSFYAGILDILQVSHRNPQG
ncbi:MAG: hypothetical protein RDV48_27445 [Candidatus Eremiobacteraeota bacterium]|nr:hypothetical protein [Candidatus Eremiobacteraeota bacterium]